MTRPPRARRAAPLPAPTDARPQDAPATPGAGPFVLLVGGVALVLRLLHVWQMHDTPYFTVLMGDARAYDAWAQQIAAGDWIGRDVFYQAPLYPYFLAGVYSIAGHDTIVVRVVQALLGSAACVLLGLTGRRLFSQRAGLVTGLGLAIYAPAVFFDGLMQKSVLDVFFICLSSWLLSDLIREPRRTRTWIWLGLAMGGLSLTRENALVLVFIVALWALAGIRTSRPERLRSTAAFVLAIAAVLLPVAVRNHAVGGGFYLTTSQFGPNFYIGNHAGADGTYASLRFGRGAPEYERQDATELAELASGRTLTPAEVSSYWTGRAIDFITTQPASWMTLMGRKVLLLWNRSEMVDTESQETYAERSLPLRATGWFAHFGVLVPLALFGVVVTWSDRRRLGILYALTLAYAASVVMFYVFARYRFPLVPFLVLFAGAGLAAGAAWIRARRFGQLASVAGALVAAAVFANWPVLSSSLMRAITESNLAAALQEDNRIDEALAHYRRAIDIRPDYAPAYNNMGTALRANGQVDQAIAVYQRALAAAPDYPDAHYNLANALLEQNRHEEAAEHFRIALRSIPDSAGTRNNLGIALMNEGKVEEAIEQFQQALQADPQSTKTLRNLAGALASRGRTQEAIGHLQRAIEIDPEDDAALYDLGGLLLEGGRLPEAEAALRKALAINPKSVEAHNNLGIALGSQGRMGEAVAEFKAALALNPDFPDAQRNLQIALAKGAQGR
jgi:tetratricopeptide (TPR) repeat protein